MSPRPDTGHPIDGSAERSEPKHSTPDTRPHGIYEPRPTG